MASAAAEDAALDEWDGSQAVTKVDNPSKKKFQDLEDMTSTSPLSPYSTVSTAVPESPWAAASTMSDMSMSYSQSEPVLGALGEIRETSSASSSQDREATLRTTQLQRRKRPVTHGGMHWSHSGSLLLPTRTPIPSLSWRPSAPTLSGNYRNPLKQKPPYRGPEHPFHRRSDVGITEVDNYGFPDVQVNRPDHGKEWEENHHLRKFTTGRRKGDTRSENDGLPLGTRQWLGPPSHEAQRDLPALKAHLSTLRHGAPLLKAMEAPEDPKKPGTPKKLHNWAADVLNSKQDSIGLDYRHTYGGNMLDRDGKVRMWNDRWHRSIAAMNEGLHGSHRQYFVQESLFETSPSQRWRRYLDQEVASGVWTPITMKKPPIFGKFGA